MEAPRLMPASASDASAAIFKSAPAPAESSSQSAMNAPDAKLRQHQHEDQRPVRMFRLDALVSTRPRSGTRFSGSVTRVVEMLSSAEGRPGALAER